MSLVRLRYRFNTHKFGRSSTLPGNVKLGKDSDGWLHHSFVTDYLKSKNGRDKIKASLVKAYKDLKYPILKKKKVVQVILKKTEPSSPVYFNMFFELNGIAIRNGLELRNNIVKLNRYLQKSMI